MSSTQADQYDRKWGPPDDPISQENKEKTLVAAPSDKQFYVQKNYDRKIQYAKTPEEKLAWTFLKAQSLDHAQGRAENAEIVRDFHLWLQGKSPNNRRRLNDNKKMPLLTPWEDQSLFHLADVREYFNRFVTKRSEFESKLHILRMNPPSTLGEAWLYYKYLVRGHLAHREFDLANGMLEFLDDFSRYTYGVVRDDKHSSVGVADTQWVESVSELNDELKESGADTTGTGAFGGHPDASQAARAQRYRAIAQWAEHAKEHTKGGRVAMNGATMSSLHVPGALFWLHDSDLTERIDATVGPDVRSGIESTFMDDTQKAAAAEIIARRLAAEDSLAKLAQQRVILQEQALQAETAQAASVAGLQARLDRLKQQAENTPMDVAEEIDAMEVEVKQGTAKLAQIRQDNSDVIAAIDKEREELIHLGAAMTAELQKTMVEGTDATIAAIREQTQATQELSQRLMLNEQTVAAQLMKAKAEYDLEVQKLQNQAKADAARTSLQLQQLKNEMLKARDVKREVTVKQEASGLTDEERQELARQAQEAQNLRARLEEQERAYKELLRKQNGAVYCTILQGTIKSMDETINEMDNQFTLKRQELSQRYQEIEGERFNFEQQLTAAQAQLSVLGGQIGTINALSAERAAALAAEQAKYTETTTQIERLRAQLVQAGQSGTAELSSIQAELQDLIRQKEEDAFNLAQLEDDLRTMKDKTAMLLGQREGAQSEFTAAKQEVARLQTELQAAKDTKGELARKRDDQARAIEAARNKAHMEYEQQKNQLEAEQQSQQEELESLARHVAMTERQVENARQQAQRQANMEAPPVLGQRHVSVAPEIMNGPSPVQPSGPVEEAQMDTGDFHEFTEHTEVNEVPEPDQTGREKAFKTNMIDVIATMLDTEGNIATEDFADERLITFMITISDALRAKYPIPNEGPTSPFALYEHLKSRALDVVATADRSIQQGIPPIDPPEVLAATKLLANLGLAFNDTAFAWLVNNNQWGFGEGERLTDEGLDNIIATFAAMTESDDNAWMQTRLDLMGKGPRSRRLTKHEAERIFKIADDFIAQTNESQLKKEGIGLGAVLDYIWLFREDEGMEKWEAFYRLGRELQKQSTNTLDAVASRIEQFRQVGYLPGDIQMAVLDQRVAELPDALKGEIDHAGWLSLLNGRGVYDDDWALSTGAVDSYLTYIAKESEDEELQTRMNDFASWDGAALRYYNVDSEQWVYAFRTGTSDEFTGQAEMTDAEYAPTIALAEELDEIESRWGEEEDLGGYGVPGYSRAIFGIQQDPTMTRDIAREYKYSVRASEQSSIDRLVGDLTTAWVAAAKNAGVPKNLRRKPESAAAVMDAIKRGQLTLSRVTVPDGDFWANTPAGNLVRDSLNEGHPEDQLSVLRVLSNLSRKVKQRMAV